MARRKQPGSLDLLLDQLLAGSEAKSAFAKDGLLVGLKKASAERALNAEMDHHLDQESEGENTRNGYGRKTVLTDTGKIDLAIPRDRLATFDPQLIARYQRKWQCTPANAPVLSFVSRLTILDDDDARRRTAASLSAGIALLIRPAVSTRTRPASLRRTVFPSRARR